MKNNLKIAYYLQISSLFTYLIIGYFVAGFVRLGLEQWILSILGSLATTFFLNSVLKNRLNYFSSIISGTAVFLITSSLEWYGYLILSSVAVISKSIFKDKNNQHIFNPAGISILFCIILFPKLIVLDAIQFIVSPNLMLIVIFMGLLTNIFVGKIPLTLGFVIGYFLGSIIRANLEPEAFEFFFFPIFNPTYLIFIFHMLSDPKVSPRPIFWQFLAGISIALIDHLLRQFNVLYSPLIALSLFTSIFYIYKCYNPTKFELNSSTI